MNLPDGKDWLMAPVIAGMCSYRDLLEGPIDLFALAEMNDALTIRDENTRRAQAAQEEEAGRHG